MARPSTPLFKKGGSSALAPGVSEWGTGTRTAGSAPALRSVRRLRARPSTRTPQARRGVRGAGANLFLRGGQRHGGKPPRTRSLVGAGREQRSGGRGLGGRDCGAPSPQDFRAALPCPAARADLGSRKVFATSRAPVPWRRAGCGAVRSRSAPPPPRLPGRCPNRCFRPSRTSVTDVRDSWRTALATCTCSRTFLEGAWGRGEEGLGGNGQEKNQARE